MWEAWALSGERRAAERRFGRSRRRRTGDTCSGARRERRRSCWSVSTAIARTPRATWPSSSAFPARRAGLCLAVDALHAFYAGSTGEVLRGWMTRELREEAIADNVAYVRRILDAVRPEIGWTVPLAFLGFSQGASMAWRAALLAGHGGAPPPAVVALGRRHPAGAFQARRSVSPNRFCSLTATRTSGTPGRNWPRTSNCCKQRTSTRRP